MYSLTSMAKSVSSIFDFAPVSSSKRIMSSRTWDSTSLMVAPEAARPRVWSSRARSITSWACLRLPSKRLSSWPMARSARLYWSSHPAHVAGGAGAHDLLAVEDRGGGEVVDALEDAVGLDLEGAAFAFGHEVAVGGLGDEALQLLEHVGDDAVGASLAPYSAWVHWRRSICFLTRVCSTLSSVTLIMPAGTIRRRRG